MTGQRGPRRRLSEPAVPLRKVPASTLLSKSASDPRASAGCWSPDGARAGFGRRPLQRGPQNSGCCRHHNFHLKTLWTRNMSYPSCQPRIAKESSGNPGHRTMGQPPATLPGPRLSQAPPKAAAKPFDLPLSRHSRLPETLPRDSDSNGPHSPHQLLPTRSAYRTGH